VLIRADAAALTQALKILNIQSISPDELTLIDELERRAIAMTGRNTAWDWVLWYVENLELKLDAEQDLKKKAIDQAHNHGQALAGFISMIRGLRTKLITEPASSLGAARPRKPLTPEEQEIQQTLQDPIAARRKLWS
jgi:hypothetical protein